MAAPRALIVDDEEGNRDLLAARLGMDGLEIDTAADGMEALDKVKSFIPDIVLLDVMMPNMDGFEVCRRLKGSEETKYIPIVMLTAKGEVEDKVLGLDIGAEDYITKPFSLNEVSARVRSLLKMRAIHRKLREVEKMAALGEMVDGIAHEIRNPLMTIGGLARRLKDKETDAGGKEYALRIIAEVERLERMVQRIDEYKDVLVPELKEGDINCVVNEAVDELNDTMAGRDIKLHVVLMDDPPPMAIDESNMKLALFNILQNSVEAIEGSGEVWVKTLACGNGTVEIRIRDNGSGMDEEFLRNIFNPFYTSKTRGAGLGLTISYKIIQDHGGDIDVDSTKGRGTIFKVRLPVLKGTAGSVLS